MEYNNPPKKERKNPSGKEAVKSPSTLHTILVIEDDPAHIELMKRAFAESHEIFNLFFSGTLTEAKNCISEQSPDLILADWLLPDGKGADLLKHQKEQGGIPVIIMTSHGNEELAVETLKAGAIDYIVKSGKNFQQLPFIVKNAWLEWHAEYSRKQMEDALAQNELKYREIFNNINDAIQIHEIDEQGNPGKFIEVNEVACRMLQYTPEEFMERKPLDFGTGFHSRPIKEITRDLRDIGHATFETEHVRKDGSIVPVEVNAHVVTIRGEKLVISVVRDITERKKAESELKASAENYRTLIESANEGIFILQDGKIPFANPKASEIIGYDGEHLSRYNMFNVIHPDDRAAALKRYHDRLSGIPVEPDTIYRIIDSSGTTHWLDIDAVLVTWNEKPATLNFATDITERKLAEDALRGSERKFQRLVEFSKEGILLIDEQGIVIQWNPAAETILGIGKEEALGQKIWDVRFNIVVKERRTPDTYERLKKLIQEFLLTGEAYWINRAKDQEIERSDGIRRIVQFNTFPVPTESGFMAASIIHDITERKKIEEALQESLHEKELLLKEIHHRVKNNLQIVSGLLYLESRRSEDNATKIILESCRDRISSMALLHESLYQVSSNFASIKVFDYVNTLIQYLNESYNSNKRIGVVINIPREMYVDIDTGNALGLIITELFTNVLKYAFPDKMPGNVILSMERSGPDHIFIMKDNGKGFPEGFDLLKNSNLGMKLVTNLVRQIRGTIQIDSSKETVITISFPSLKPPKTIINSSDLNSSLGGL